MAENLVIVESPAKAKTIEGFLGKNFIVKSSYGHVRDLAKNDKAVDIRNNFEPVYQVPEEKQKVVSELSKLSKKAKTIWLATDEDREGEAISWHLFESLGLKESNTRRIVFHEITKTAIEEAIANPRKIDLHLVDAQQARRILDRLVGFELSPVLWKKVRPQLSAGRVQSVAVRLIVEREREIEAHTPVSSYKVIGHFVVYDDKGYPKFLKAELPEKFKDKDAAIDFLNQTLGSSYSISSLETKPGKRSPSAPFTTSTLQQEASRKLGFSVAQTMVIAQRLYESGKITYMRTDSVNLSQFAMDAAKKEIEKSFGEKYHFRRQYKTKSASAQEAHEAIRPTYFENATLDADATERKLYELIWKRAIASQMSDAELEKTIVTINSDKTPELFQATGEVITFDGFLKVYLESSDDETLDKEDEGLLPPLEVGQKLEIDFIEATEKFTRPAARYSEASLVKKLEELGIGRPSTYAPTISTIQKRGYVLKEDRMGRERNYQVITLKDNQVTQLSKTEITGTEKAKLFPTDIGTVVTDFLVKNFSNILDYNFTAYVEKEFDDIAEGHLSWRSMLAEFYKPFHEKIEITEKTSERASGERILGIDPESGKTVSVRIGRYGPMAQKKMNDEDEKPQYAKLRSNQRLETITLEEALSLFKLPRNLGIFEGEELQVSIGRFGPYVRMGGNFFSLPKGDDPYEISFERAVEIIEAKRLADLEKTLREFPENPDLKILKGRWGPFIKFGKRNIRMPKDQDYNLMTYDQVMQLAEKDSFKSKAVKTDNDKEKKSEKKSAPKKSTAKKQPAKRMAGKKSKPKNKS